MLASQREKPRKWREFAEELRIVAAQVEDAPTRQSLMDLAASWDSMAMRTERLERLEA